jgi:valyl-tRNA synthetase
MAMEKTFDARTAEPEVSAWWEEADAFRAGANARSGPNGEPAPAFSMVLPPPNVTGSLHMGHAFNHTLMDVLARWHRMQGHDVLWQPGLDHAGIATQMVVERRLAASGNISRRDMGREAFVEKVWEWKEESGGTILEQSKRLGDSFDLSRNRFTMDEGFHDAVLRTFVDFYDRGLIFRGKRLVNWDPHFETAISDLEVENIEVPGHMWHFKYRLAGGETYEYVEKDADGNVTLRETRDYISIATTRPETMLGDGAVAVHPSDERYAPIVGKMVQLPLCDRLIPIVTDEYPDPEFGSGAVKITGAHDFNDYKVAERNGLPMYRLMDTRGRMRADGTPYAEAVARAREIAAGSPTNGAEVDTLNLVPEAYRGLDRFDARKAVIADINAAGLAVTVTNADGEAVPYVEAKPITQPFGDRSKVVIEPMLTDQWFVDTSDLARQAMDAVRDGRTRILPERDEKTYFHWLENIEPWCISRQLWWGHQIPVWYGAYVDPEGHVQHDAGAPAASDEPHVYVEQGRRVRAFCGATADAVREDAENWYRARLGERVVVRFEGEPEAESGAFPEEADSVVITLGRDPDVLDTWFSSGIWPLGTLGWPEDTAELKRYYPTSVLVTGFDIIFFWVARMMMMQLAIVGEVPFRDVYIHALVRDEKGKKMSKSLGNVLDPIELIDEYGADAVRFTLAAMAAMGRDLKLSKERIAGYRNFGTKLWNAARFAEMNGCVADPAFDPKAVTLTANRWIVGETGKLREALDAAIGAYRYNDAANALYAHVWGKVCDWYVELAKPLFQSDGAAETRATMAWVLDQCLILMHPFMPFITETLWAADGERATLLAHADWPTYGAELVETDADTEMNWVIGLIEEIRSVRAQMRVPAGAKVTLVELDLAPARAEALERNRALVARLARIETFESAAEAPKGAVTITVPEGTFCLPLAGVIDVAAERDRLAKALDKLGKEAKGLRAKLSNEAFVARAPEEVVDEQRARLEAAEEEMAILKAAGERLAGL